MDNNRRTATFIVLRWLKTREFPSAMLPDGADRAFVQDLVYTVIRRLRSLRHILGELVAKWPKGELESLLYVGAAQILYMDDVPDYAAVNETVEAAKCSPNRNLARVVNGVLHNLIRRRDELLSALAAAPLAERESFPTELVRRWIDRFGEASADRLCQYHNQPAETFLARRDGSFVALERGCRVSEVAGYDTGEFIVQDPATRLAVELMGVCPRDAVLDACAAPGGKAIQMCWRGAVLTACEVNPKRRRQLMDNLTRTRTEAKVVSSLDEAAATGPFAKVLVDAPCSNTGVLRRRPDARWNWSLTKLQSLVKLQAEILDRVSSLVAPGGTLVYSTCSVEPEENELQVESFLARHPEFSLVEQKLLVPPECGCDGAFAAKLQR